MADAEIVIKGGTVMEGTGAPGRRADPVMAGARVVDVAEPSAKLPRPGERPIADAAEGVPH
jgi:N-acyl-D-amino-acid deacylase